MQRCSIVECPDTSAPLFEQAVSLFQLIFGLQRPFCDEAERWRSILGKQKRWLLLCAIGDGRMVGFKLGYELSDTDFYSWLGGVHPDYRRHGIATLLLATQHRWCQEHGYSAIVTKTSARWDAMLRLNCHAGFAVIGTEPDRYSGFRYILRRQLAQCASRNAPTSAA